MAGIGCKLGLILIGIVGTTAGMVWHALITTFFVGPKPWPKPPPKHSLQDEINKLNDQQKRAVQCDDTGNVVTIAGAGTGKTTVVTLRIAHLIETCNVRPSSIMALTFTNKAAAEMKDRVKRFVGHDVASQISISTFHSMCVSILRRHGHHKGLAPDFAVLADPDEGMFASICSDLGCGDKHKARELWQQISTARNNGVDPRDTVLDPAALEAFSEYRKRCARYDVRKEPFEKACRDAQVPENLWKEMRSMLRQHVNGTLHIDPADKLGKIRDGKYGGITPEMLFNQACDFDEMINLVTCILQENEGVRQQIRSKYTHLFVDEFQDTNKAQVMLLQCLVNKHIFAVGDDKQSIYAWRGSCSKYMLDFAKYFGPTSRVLPLQYNYRCQAVIIEAANEVIRCNSNQAPFPLELTKPAGDLIQWCQYADEGEQAAGIADCVVTAVHEHGQSTLQDTVVLCRTNHAVAFIRNALYKHNVPDTTFFGRAIVKNAMALMRVLAADSHAEKKEEMMRIFGSGAVKGVGIKTAEKHRLYSLNAVASRGPNTNSRARDALAAFHKNMKTAQNMLLLEHVPQHEVCRWITNHVSWASDNDGEEPPSEDIGDDDDSLTDCSVFQILLGMLKEGTTLSPHDSDQCTNCIHIMTLHAAKGLEFDTVHIANVSHGMLPHKQLHDLEEERRLFYVGMTRAKNMLHLHGVAQPSTFLAEIPSQFVDVSTYN